MPDYTIEELQSMAYPDLAKKSSSKDSIDYTIEELEAMAKPKEETSLGSKETSLGDKVKAFGANAINEATLGYLPQIAGAFSSQMYGKPYVQERDRAISGLKQLSQENPRSALAGSGAGLVGSMFVPGGAAAKGAGLASKIFRGGLTGAALSGVSNPGDVEGQIDPLQLEERTGSSAIGGGLGAAIPIAGSAIQRGAKSDLGAKALKNISDTMAVKQAGAMLKDFRQLFDKNQLGDVAKTLKNETVQMEKNGTPVVEKLLSAGDSFDDVAVKALKLKEQTGQKIGNIYSTIDETLTNPNLKLSPESAQKLGGAKRFNPVNDLPEIQQILADKYGKQLGGKQIMAKVQSVLDDFSGRSDSLSDALALKGELDDMINYARKSQDLPGYQKALIDVRNFIRDKTNKYAEDVADVVGLPEAKNLKALNKTYGNVSKIEDIASDRVQRESANRTFGLTDYLAAGAIGGASGMSGQNSTPESLLYAGMGALGNKAMRRYGPGVISRGAELGGGLAGKINPFSQGVLSPAAKASEFVSSPLRTGLAASALERRMNDIDKKKNQGK